MGTNVPASVAVPKVSHVHAVQIALVGAVALTLRSQNASAVLIANAIVAVPKANLAPVAMTAYANVVAVLPR